MAADDLTAALEEAQKIADTLHFACRLPDKKPDFTACGGPAAKAYWEYFTPARITALLAAVKAAADRTSTVKCVQHGCLTTDGPGEDVIVHTGGNLDPYCSSKRFTVRWERAAGRAEALAAMREHGAP